MQLWKYRDYVSPSGVNQIAKWMSELTIQDRSTVRTLLLVMSRKRVWTRPDFEWLSGRKYAGLGEIRWKSEQRTPLRLIGFMEADNFVFLIGCSHKDRVYKPPQAMDTAADRKKKLDNGTASTCEHIDD